MITLHWYDQTFIAQYAVKGTDYVALYGLDFVQTMRIINIHGQEWKHISLDGGEWSDPESIPSGEEILRADIDFLTMENEALEDDVEQAKADIDYLLMITDEE